MRPRPRALWIGAGSLLLIGAAPAGTDLNSPLHHWFESQHSMTGSWCCDIADGHILSDSEWREVGDRYEVKIHNIWVRVPPSSLRDPKGGPNPTGQAIVWYRDPPLRIWCFAPGTQF